MNLFSFWFQCIPQTYYELQPLHIIFMAVNVCMWISLYHANTINPGFLPRNIPEYDQAIRQVGLMGRLYFVFLLT